MPQITLEQIAEITGGTLTGDGSRLIDSLETDSRSIYPGEKKIFLAIRGQRHDGHTFIPELIERGIENFLAERSDVFEKAGNTVNFVEVSNSINALHQLAGWYRKNLTMPLIAITGSNGKTVVKEWLAQCLSHFGIVSRTDHGF